MIDSTRQCSKKLFKIIKNLTNQSQETPLPESSSLEVLANTFSDYFLQKVTSILDQFGSGMPSDGTCDCAPFNVFEPVTTSYIRDLISKSPITSCALDPLPASVVRVCLDVLISHITAITNFSLSQAVFPYCFKQAVVRPLIKKQGLPTEMSNYRPVSNLSFISKVIERVVTSQLIKHLDQNSLAEKFQSAYKQYHSTETALTRVHNDILMAMDKQKVSLLVMLDLSAAFDTVNIDILL